MQLKAKKLLIGLSSSLVIIVLSTIGVLYYILYKSVPDYDTTITTEGLSNSVKIYYDDFGSPHIIAENEQDLFFAQGYVHARDRLWQMDIQRRAAQGRLAEIFGKDALGYDKHMRTIGVGRMADSIWKSSILSDLTRQTLEAYSNGVNAFIKQAQDGEHHFTIEFNALSYEPESWKPEDCLSIIRMMGWEMNGAWNIDVALAEITKKLGPETAMDLYPKSHANALSILKSAHLQKHIKNANSQNPVAETMLPDLGEANLEGLLAFHESDREYRAWSKTLGSHVGSNSWAVSPKKSKSGGAMLANDPHLGFVTPSRWHEMQLYCKPAGIDVSGGSLPGVPTIVIGKNNRIAWGLTNLMIDDCDFFMTSDSLENGYTIIEEMITVKDGDPEPLLISQSKFGVVLPSPIINSRLYTNSSRLDSLDIAMKWTGHVLSDETLAFIKLNKAQNWTQFREALKDFAIPGQNFMYADVEGNIGLQATGLIPIRNDRNGFMLRDAANPEHHWKGYVAYNEMPYVLNPPEGIIITANNKLTDGSYKYYISSLWEPDSRAARIQEHLNSKSTFDTEDFRAIQFDRISIQSRRLLPYLLQALSTDTAHAHQKPIAYLENWDSNFDQASIGATIFTQFYMRLLYNTYGDELGDGLFLSYMELINAPSRVMQHMIEDTAHVQVVLSDSTTGAAIKTNRWFDNINTNEVESRDDILRKSFSEAIAILRRHLGEDEQFWRWEAIHKLSVQHIFGQAGGPENESIVTKLFNFKTVVTGGNATSINNGEFRYKHVDFSKDALVNASHQVGASSRRVIDMADPGKFYSIMPGGNSCDIMSDHYSDQLEMWVNGELREFITNPDRFEELGYDLTTLSLPD